MAGSEATLHDSVRDLEQRVGAARDERERLGLLLQLAGRLAGGFRTREGLRRTREALGIARKLGDRAAVAQALTAATLCHYHRADYHSAVATGVDALEALSPDDPAGRSGALQSIALALFAIGDFARAEDAAERAAREAELSGERDREASAYNVCGFIYADDGRYADARRAFRRSARIYRALGEALMVKKVACNLGHTYRKEGAALEARQRPGEARRRWRHALGVYRIGLATGSAQANDAIVLGSMGECEWRLGRAEAARAHLEQSLELAQAVGAPRIAASCALWSSRVLESAGESAAAERVALAALSAAEQLEHDEILSECLRHLAGLRAARGDAVGAREAEERAGRATLERSLALAAACEQTAPLWDRFAQAHRAATKAR